MVHLVEEPLDARVVAHVDASVRGTEVAARREVGGVVHRLAAGEEHRERHRGVVEVRDVVARLPAHVEEAFAGRGVRRTEAHRHRPEHLPVDHPADGAARLVDAHRAPGQAARVESARRCAGRRGTGWRARPWSAYGSSRAGGSRVRWSTYPVSAIFRFSWKPFRAAVVWRSQSSLTLPKYHAIWRSRDCRSRTFGPWSPAPRRRGPGSGTCFGRDAGRGAVTWRRGAGRGRRRGA